MTSSPKLQIPDHIVYQDIDGELVLLDLNQGVYYGLKDVGKRCWELIAENQDRTGIIEAVVQEYDVSPELLISDLDTLLADFTTKGLVTIAE
ncbi:PqqD family protein [Thermosynechococcaceae cyanobacterium BACA0444]|uniref:PqqD family protein n=1 Tax=Pseudocalidococcus azoricus BACA0444 TaxID=2918990 RepID=A0AAE4FTB7_9CYAN|nr:PqqD family protein [Pseudocalidococcus azoricus]MDS3861860.1 PqqD family protein [Pseudocalidococcus azoricus BACA0444]